MVSLAPHLTELVYTAGAGERLVGVVEYSNYPAAARNLARIGDAFRIDMEALAALDPDLILAWAGGNPAVLLDDLRRRGYRVEALATGTLDNIAVNLRRIGELSGHRGTAEAAADRYLQALDALRQRYRGASPLRVFVQIGRQPLYTVSAAHAIGQIVELCGGTNVFAALPGLAAAVGAEAVVAADPEVIVTTGDADQLDHWRRFSALRAVADGALFGTDADVLTRDSTRILQGAEQVCAHLDTARAAAGRHE